MTAIPAGWNDQWFAVFRRKHAIRGYCVIEDGHFIHVQAMEVCG